MSQGAEQVRKARKKVRERAARANFGESRVHGSRHIFMSIAFRMKSGAHVHHIYVEARLYVHNYDQLRMSTGKYLL